MMNRVDNYKLEMIDLTDDTTVTHAPTSITNQLKPPVGFVYEIINIIYSAPDPAGSAAGTHQLTIEQAGAANFIMRVRGTTGTTISIMYNGLIGDSLEAPSAIADQFKIMRETTFASNDLPLDFIYTNTTDVDQSGTRTLEVYVKKYREAS